MALDTSLAPWVNDITAALKICTQEEIQSMYNSNYCFDAFLFAPRCKPKYTRRWHLLVYSVTSGRMPIIFHDNDTEDPLPVPGPARTYRYQVAMSLARCITLKPNVRACKKCAQGELGMCKKETALRLGMIPRQTVTVKL